MRRFAKTVVKVLLSYVEIVKADFPDQMKDERIVSVISHVKWNLFNLWMYVLGLCPYE